MRLSVQNVNWDGNTRSVYIDSDEDTVTAQVIENASSSVVAIVGNYKPEYMTGTVSNYNELTAHGTGVVIKSGGIILTNAHVVSDIDNITVVFLRRRKLCRTSSGNRQRFRLGFGKGWPSWFKANIVRTIGQYLRRAVRCCNRYSPFAFNAKQCIKRYRKRLNVSTPSAYYPLIQTDAAINAGNSGGPLLNMKGQS